MNHTFEKPLIIAHRGASAFAPENTLAAFKEAVEIGAEGIEFDVRLSKDNIPVVFHDADLKRITKKNALVKHFSSADLQKLDAGSWFNIQNPDKAKDVFSNEKISTLEQTLDFLKDYKGLIYVELKCEEMDVEPFCRRVCEVIKNSDLVSQIIVKSFHLDMLPFIKKYCPQVKTAALFAPNVLILLRKEKRLINIAKELDVNYLSIHFSLATQKLIRKAKKQDLKSAIWTADNPRWIKRGLKLEIDHIITNNPARLLEKRREIL